MGRYWWVLLGPSRTRDVKPGPEFLELFVFSQDHWSVQTKLGVLIGYSASGSEVFDQALERPGKSYSLEVASSSSFHRINTFHRPGACPMVTRAWACSWPTPATSIRQGPDGESRGLGCGEEMETLEL